MNASGKPDILDLDKETLTRKLASEDIAAKELEKLDTLDPTERKVRQATLNGDT